MNFLAIPRPNTSPQCPRWARGAALTDPVGGVVQLRGGAGHAAAGVRGRVAAGPLAVLQGRRRGRAVLDPLLQAQHSLIHPGYNKKNQTGRLD